MSIRKLIQAKREDKEAILQATHGLDVNSLTADEFDEVMNYVGNAYAWLAQYEQLDETLFDLQQTLRQEERVIREERRKAKVVA